MDTFYTMLRLRRTEWSVLSFCPLQGAQAVLRQDRSVTGICRLSLGPNRLVCIAEPLTAAAFSKYAVMRMPRISPLYPKCL